MVRPVTPKSLSILTFCLNVESPVTYKSVISNAPTNFVAVKIPVKYALVPVTNPTVVTPVTRRFLVVVVPVTLRLSISVCPINLEYPLTSSRYSGFVLPIPIRLLISSNTKLGAPSNNPAIFWN